MEPSRGEEFLKDKIKLGRKGYAALNQGIHEQVDKRLIASNVSTIAIYKKLSY
jgi:hypothetical protein